ncbi:MAG: DUF924 domain-containing protein [Proteobacteria bacterium]|nr:DUF924 domain-containing protein [Pseudomonadota bacterium]MBS0464531.1 DUF924 domain-containing protein [Pseudomonadota bacterium]
MPAHAEVPPLALALLACWREAGYRRWFTRNANFDERLRTDFGAAHMAAARRELDDWMSSADGALALVLLLDQIPRNIFRDSAHAFATDPLARQHASAAIDAGFDAAVDASLRMFFYLPFEHSEALADQDESMRLFTALGDASTLDYARRHHEAIARFGRFPHRNAALGRTTTQAEQQWLDAGGGFG